MPDTTVQKNGYAAQIGAQKIFVCICSVCMSAESMHVFKNSTRMKYCVRKYNKGYFEWVVCFKGSKLLLNELFAAIHFVA